MDTFQPAFSSWLNAPAHQQWLAAEGLRLLAFAKASKLAQGFGNLDEKGCLAADAQAGGGLPDEQMLQVLHLVTGCSSSASASPSPSALLLPSVGP